MAPKTRRGSKRMVTKEVLPAADSKNDEHSDSEDDMKRRNVLDTAATDNENRFALLHESDDDDDDLDVKAKGVRDDAECATGVKSSSPYSSIRFSDGVYIGEGMSTVPALTSSVSWSCHNVLCVVAKAARLTFSIGDPQRQLCVWDFAPRTGKFDIPSRRTLGIRRVLWAPGLREGCHFPPATWACVLFDNCVWVGEVSRHGDRKVEVTRKLKFVLPAAQRPTASVWWLTDAVWLSNEVLAVFTSESVHVVDMRVWEAQQSSAEHTATIREQRKQRTHAAVDPASSRTTEQRQSIGSASLAVRNSIKRARASDDQTTSSSESASASESSAESDDDGESKATWIETPCVQTPLQDPSAHRRDARQRDGGVSQQKPHGAIFQSVGRVQSSNASSVAGGCVLSMSSAGDVHVFRIAPEKVLAGPRRTLVTLVYHGVASRPKAQQFRPTPRCFRAIERPPQQPSASSNPNPNSSQTERVPPSSVAATTSLVDIVVLLPLQVEHIVLALAAESSKATRKLSSAVVQQEHAWGRESLGVSEANWVDMIPLVSLPPPARREGAVPAADDHDHSSLQEPPQPQSPSSFQTEAGCVALLLVGVRTIAGLTIAFQESDARRGIQALDAATVLPLEEPAAAVPSINNAPHIQASVLFACPTVDHNNLFPVRTAAFAVAGLALHASLQVSALVVRVVTPQLAKRRHSLLLLHALRDAATCPFTAYLSSLQVWRHFAYTAVGLDVVPRESYFLREHVLGSAALRLLRVHNERRAAMLAIGAGERSVDALRSCFTLDDSLVSDAIKSFDSLLQRYHKLCEKHGVELFIRQGSVPPKGSATALLHHWRTILLLILRGFGAQSFAVELVVGHAVITLHSWLHWSLSGRSGEVLTAGASGRKEGTVSLYNALAFLKSYLAKSDTILPENHQKSPFVPSSAQPLPSESLIASMTAFIKRVEGEVQRREAMPTELQERDACFWDATDNRCSVCQQSAVAVDASLRVVVSSCRDAAPHTSLFSPTTFRCLALYDPNTLLAQCKVCGYHDAVTAPLCGLCDGVQIA